jgi:hypothetical protein
VRCKDENGNKKPGTHMRNYDFWSSGPNMVDDKGENDGKEQDDVANWH